MPEKVAPWADECASGPAVEVTYWLLPGGGLLNREGPSGGQLGPSLRCRIGGVRHAAAV